MLHFLISQNSSTLTGGALLIKGFIEPLNVSFQFSAFSKAKLCLKSGHTSMEMCDDISLNL